MKFSELYTDNRKSVVDALKGLWCGDAINDSQKAYSKRIIEMLPNLFAPDNSMPLVQCMNLYKPVSSVSDEEARALVGGLWDKPEKKTYSPYEHQYQAWNALLKGKSPEGKPMSICVTTGTGSGKTEAFMIPLIHDLSQNVTASWDQPHHVQAIFLYPLNALMEDQKARMEELLAGTGLRYTVYNGDLPDQLPKPSMSAEDKAILQKRIDKIRGITRDASGTIIEENFPNIVATREEVRKLRPDIILTNPTMLEYILLRKRDQSIIEPAEKSLKWISIDETHSYTGAGAAELAMLLRRVLAAFDVKAEDVRFATSSATFGNADSITDPVMRAQAQAEDERKLKEFIAGITGVNINQIAVIGGERLGEEKIPENEDRERWQKIFHDEFVSLDELFPTPKTIEDKLIALDEMVERLGDSTDMKIKVHYFHRVANNGLYVKLDEIQPDGTFTLLSRNKDEKEGMAQSVELCRCKNCGEYVSIVNRDNITGKYTSMVPDDNDIFDLGDEPKDDTQIRVIGLTNKPFKASGNVIYQVKGDVLEGTIPSSIDISSWHIAANTKCRCPYCNHKLTGDIVDDEVMDEMEQGGKLRKFRVSPDFISRLMAPSILNQLEPHEESGKERLHQGQQYLSFADSRQMAAKSTLHQNLEQERLWVYTTIFHKLCENAACGGVDQEEINRLQAIIMSPDSDFNAKMQAMNQLNDLQSQSGKNYLTWTEISDILYNSKYADRYYYEFLKRSGDNNELDQDGNIDPEEKKRYILSIMTMYLSSRPRSAAAPETMGLFHTCYPLLSNVKVPTRVVNSFNAIIDNAELKIDDKDWQNLLQIFIDYRVRSDQSVYLEIPNCSIDIHHTVRFADKKPHRKPATKPELRRNLFTASRIVRYLCGLIMRDKPGISDNEAYQTYFNQINVVIDAMWHDLTDSSNKLLQVGRHYDTEQGRFVNDEDGGLRLNLNDICFKLYDEAWLSDVNSEYDDVANHAECLRPVPVNFKGFSPYLQERRAVILDNKRYEKWIPFDCYIGSGKEMTREEINLWAQKHRTILCGDGGIWSEDGIFSDRLSDIYEGPNLFIQAEHTAQVDKMVSRQLQDDFKNHDINIMACSTTMEMGVDLGTLELVMLTSVPPQPANYKQRAGRSGRNPKMVKSACITLCGSDSIGLRTLDHPLENIIRRPVEVPVVDLQSPQVVQRHVNSFLIRWFGLFGSGSVNQSVLDFYTHFILGGGVIKDPYQGNDEQSPKDKLGSEEYTLYQKFNEECSKPMSEDLETALKHLLKNTCFEGKEAQTVATAMKENKRCYDELDKTLEDIRCAFLGITGNTDRDKKYSDKLKRRYKYTMTQRLLGFWATHRFTPNANMPVSVLSLDLDPAGSKPWIKRNSANPSYSLREAIAQYAPGNSVVVDGVVYEVRGIEFHNMFQQKKSFKRIARNNDETVLDDNIPLLDDKKEWWKGSNRQEIELVEPIGFVPDSDGQSRIMAHNRYTQVNAQLIGADKWGDGNARETIHLYDIRCNRDSGDAKILYYNEGIGYGYCLCSRCGRIVLEEGLAETFDSIHDLPREYNTTFPKKIDPNTGLKVVDDTKPKYHNAVSGKYVGKSCGASNSQGEVRRNVILGGLIQTDFVEIKIRHKGKKWLNDWTEYNLLLTLGVVFSQSLVSILGKEKNSVDFTILPFGHICIFDTNPGGAGYSNQLKSRSGLMLEVLKASKSLLLTAKEKKSKDYLLDKFTIRYSKYLDIEKALEWIDDELSLNK